MTHGRSRKLEAPELLNPSLVFPPKHATSLGYTRQTPSLGTGALYLRSELLTTLFVAGAHRPRWPPSYEVVHPEEAGYSELISYWTIIQIIK